MSIILESLCCLKNGEYLRLEIETGINPEGTDVPIYAACIMSAENIAIIGTSSYVIDGAKAAEIGILRMLHSYRIREQEGKIKMEPMQIAESNCDVTDKPIDQCPCKECREACKLADELMSDEKFIVGLTDDGSLFIVGL
jgi:hypothetical protein